MLTGPTLLAEIERFLSSGACSESFFGHVSVGDGKLVPRLRAGGTVTLEKAARVVAFIEKAESSGWTRKTPDWLIEWQRTSSARVKREVSE